MTIADLEITDASSVTVSGDLILSDLITTGEAYSISLEGASNSFSSQVDFLNTGTVTLGLGGSDVFDFDGELTFGDAPINLNGTIRTSGDTIDFGSNIVTIVDATSVATNKVATGNSTFGNDVNGSQHLGSECRSPAPFSSLALMLRVPSPWLD